MCLSFVFRKLALDLLWKMAYKQIEFDAEGRATSSQATATTQGRAGESLTQNSGSGNKEEENYLRGSTQEE